MTTEGTSIDPRDSTAAKTRGELGHMIPAGPTSIEEQAENGGWSKLSPQDTTTPYDLGGQAGGGNIAAGAGK